MLLDEFWTIVDRVHAASNGDMKTKCNLLQTELEKLSSEEVHLFADHFTDCRDRAYNWELWAAAYIIGGGCSDDSFSDFRASLISMGHDFFEQTLVAPDSLAEFDDPDENIFFEGYQYVAPHVYEVMTGERPVRRNPHPKNPSGVPWNDDDLPRVCPKLYARYEGDSPLD